MCYINEFKIIIKRKLEILFKHEILIKTLYFIIIFEFIYIYIYLIIFFYFNKLNNTNTSITFILFNNTKIFVRLII